MSYTYMETEQEGQGRQGRQGGEGHSDIFSYASLPLSPSLPITQSAMQSPVLPASPAPEGDSVPIYLSAHGRLAATA